MKKPSNDRLFEANLLLIPLGLCGMAASWYLFSFGYALLFAILFFPLGYLKLLNKKS